MLPTTGIKLKVPEEEHSCLPSAEYNNMSIPNCRRLNAFMMDTETILLLPATFGISESMTGVTGSFESTGGSKHHSHT
jgi:hypothetical protein